MNKGKLLSVAICMASMFFVLPNNACGKGKNSARRIKKIQPIEVRCEQGNAPSLPFQVLVTYTDGTQEWRQTRWTNTTNSTERAQADAQQNPAGKKYSVTGFIIGDNTTDQGYPIEAKVSVVETIGVPSSTPVATPLPLKDVLLTGTNRLTNNRTLDVKNLLSINPKQMLYNYRDTYGLPTDGYPVADGWDSPTTKLKGHGTGHYLSALAFAYATEQDADVKSRLLENIRLMVNEMRECQERTFVYDEKLGRYREARDYAPEDTLRKMPGSWKAMDEYKKDYQNYGYGYMNAIPAAHPALIEMYRAYNNEDWVWAPYYTIHKQLAGLIDIAENVDDKAVADKALAIARDMGLWVWNRLHYRTYVKTDGDKRERQAKPGNRYEMWNMYIAGEVGGMEESLARLSMMVSNTEQKAHLLEAAKCFDAPAFFNPLTHNIDDIRTRHANQHIPMITGALRTYMAGGEKDYYNLASNFWNMIQGRYVYAMGGVGNGEMWRQPYSQILSMNTNVMSDWHRKMHPNPDLNETCCAYNLAKLTKDLNSLSPNDARYMDYYERVLMNQLVGSVNPNEFACTYQYAVGMNAIKPYGNETPQSTCCGGTGAENHVKYQEAAYFVGGDTMWVALYMPTQAYWREKDVTVSQDCTWPAEHTTLTVLNGAATRGQNSTATSEFAMKLRIPYWATSGISIKLNGKEVAKTYSPCSYVEIPKRTWKSGDVVEIYMPYQTHVNFGPDKMEVAAVEGNTSKQFKPSWVGTLMYGPLVMATSDVTTWDDADVTLESNLSNIKPAVLGSGATIKSPNPATGLAHKVTKEGTDGTGGPLYALTLTDKSKNILFTPDYFQTGHSTHYLRMNVLGSEPGNTKEQLKINRSMLDQALETARQRKAEQEAWMALAVKVPEHSPWAPNGYARLMKEMEKAAGVSTNTSATATNVADALSALNVAINTMRPGNLAEPEDLSTLLPLVTNAKNIANKTTELREAINYADMVVQYVNDGSGTHDLIRKATERLNKELESFK